MGAKILPIGDNFWNIRGSFKIGGLIDIGTQASLVRLANGKFVFLDSYTFDDATQQEIDDLTKGGEDIEAVLNLHPFHTIHVPWMHKQYPDAMHYGTTRHLSRFPELQWQRLPAESPELHTMYAQDFDFSVPRGVDFISDDENIHFSSVLVMHRESKTIHVDDTLMFVRLPVLMRFFGLKNAMSFHPTLSKVLEKRPGAANEFSEWAEELADKWHDVENLCAAHTAALLASDNDNSSIHDRMINALEKVRKTLTAHEQKHG